MGDIQKDQSQVLRRLQLTELEILRVIDRFCSENQIRYSLYDGTLLGAVRHKGFIPWDDDLDICMMRDEYDRFLKAWNRCPPEGYLLQNKDNTPAFSQSFSKIRKKHTTFLQSDWEKGRFHTGIFVDIFPIDRLPEKGSARKTYQAACMIYHLFMREFVPEKASRGVRAGAYLLLNMVPKKLRPWVRGRALRYLTKFDRNEDCPTVGMETVEWARKPMPPDLHREYVRLPFEDGQFLCFSNWDGLLKAHFGDYMTPPPESERVWTHHPLLIDFEHDYEELQE